MLLHELLIGLDYSYIGDIDLNIEKISTNSASNCKNGVFVCLKGTNTDGHNYVNDAKNNGAIALVVEKKVKSSLPQIIVKDTHCAISIMARNYYQNYNKKIKFIGITGTNGKTTTSFILKSILEEAGYKVGVIGTLGVCYDCKVIESNLTTPDPLNLHKMISQMYDEGVEIIVMEVSAHAIDQMKVCSIMFDIGIFTNLSQDHLDYFVNMEQYSKVKASFFSSNYIKTALVNIDDNLGKAIAKSNKIPCITYGMNNPSDVFAIDIISKIDKSTFLLNLFDNCINITSSLIGKYNVYNIMAAATASVLLGVSLKNIQLGIEKCKFIDGRINLIQVKDYNVIIDFAHTPDGLKNVLSTIKACCDGRVITIFGCGGNRDVDKRKIMGKEAEKYSNFTIITSDNPRYENPENIARDIEKGFTKDNYIVEIDRKKAIQIGMALCRKDDCLVICGKGGEKYQDINGVKVPYSDIDEVLKVKEKVEYDK